MLQTTRINDWEDIDLVLRDLGITEYEIEKDEAKMTEAIQKIKERYKDELNTKYDEVRSIRKEIETFCAKHRDDFDGKQTKNLNFGKIKFRLGKSSYVFLKKQADIAESLIQMKLKECVKTEKRVIKSALKDIATPILQKLGIKQVPGMLSWFIEPFRDKIIPTNEQEK